MQLWASWRNNKMIMSLCHIVVGDNVIYLRSVLGMLTLFLRGRTRNSAAFERSHNDKDHKQWSLWWLQSQHNENDKDDQSQIMMGMGSKMMIRADESSSVIGLHDDGRCSIMGSMMMRAESSSVIKVQHCDGTAWCYTVKCRKRTKCNTMIGEAVTLENQLKQYVFNWSHVDIKSQSDWLLL